MKILALVGTAMLATVGIATGAQAQRVPGSIDIGVTGGTEGVGPEISYQVGGLVGIRANATFLDFGHSVKSHGVDYHGDFNLTSGGAMIDLYPFRGGFFVSAGGRINGNHVNLSATPVQNTQLGGVTFTPAQIGTITGSAETKNFAPQLTLGYRGSPVRHLMVGLEAGALFQGAVRIRDFQANGSLASNSIFATQLEIERQDVQNRVDDYKVYPVVQLRLGYRF